MKIVVIGVGTIGNNEVIIPDGNSQIKLGDNVVVVTTHKNFDDLTDVFY